MLAGTVHLFVYTSMFRVGARLEIRDGFSGTIPGKYKLCEMILRSGGSSLIPGKDLCGTNKQTKPSDVCSSK